MDKTNQVPQGVRNPHLVALMQNPNAQIRFPASSATPQNATQYTHQFQPDFVASHFAQLSQQQQYPIQQTHESLQLNQNFTINNNNQDTQEAPRNAPKEIKEQEMFLPKENIRKVMKKVLPTYAKISREAIDCIQECATEFILFALGEASDIAQNQKRKIVCGSHIVEAFHTLGLDFYSSLMKVYLQQLKASQVTSSKTKKRKRNKDVSESEADLDENSNDPEELYEQEISSLQQQQQNVPSTSNLPTEITIPSNPYRTLSTSNSNNSSMQNISNNNNNVSTTPAPATSARQTALPTLQQLQELYRQLYPDAPMPSFQPTATQPSTTPTNAPSNNTSQPLSNYPPQPAPGNYTNFAPQQTTNYPHSQQPQVSFSQQPTTTSQPSASYPQPPSNGYPSQGTTYGQQPSTMYVQHPPATSYPQQQQQPASNFPQQQANYVQQPSNARPSIPIERMMSYIQQMANAQMNNTNNSNNPPSGQQPPNKRNG